MFIVSKLNYDKNITLKNQHHNSNCRSNNFHKVRSFSVWAPGSSISKQFQIGDKIPYLATSGLLVWKLFGGQPAAVFQHEINSLQV